MLLKTWGATDVLLKSGWGVMNIGLSFLEVVWRGTNSGFLTKTKSALGPVKIWENDFGVTLLIGSIKFPLRSVDDLLRSTGGGVTKGAEPDKKLIRKPN